MAEVSHPRDDLAHDLRNASADVRHLVLITAQVVIAFVVTILIEGTGSDHQRFAIGSLRLGAAAHRQSLRQGFGQVQDRLLL